MCFHKKIHTLAIGCHHVWIIPDLTPTIKLTDRHKWSIGNLADIFTSGTDLSQLFSIFSSSCHRMILAPVCIMSLCQ